MLRWLLKIYWKLGGWKIRGGFPYDIPRMVMIVAPHTSWKDVLVGFAARSELNISHAKFLGKKELFDGNFGWFFRKLGGVPVDRFSKQGMVEQVVAMFRNNNNFLLGMAPEGTRKRVDKLRSGFYHIARQANVPILPVGLDFKNKEVVIGQAFKTSGNEEEDFKRIIEFFSGITGSNPENDLRHLKNIPLNL